MTDVLDTFDYKAHGWHRRYGPSLNGVRVIWVSPSISDEHVVQMETRDTLGHFYLSATGCSERTYAEPHAAAQAGIKDLEWVKRAADRALARLRETGEPVEVGHLVLPVRIVG